ncbi:Gamma-D-glutamyl-L-diamino acid endopeptidase 1 [Kordia antarctica]|uniref:Gamma-D-glutamyl-L-diamino acid endopeptidase 1 n=1 Tax=Kordia antarctica TaxID=1218801 RepID=A0A7L4ZEX7_9FLAO|nr:M14 metallopeptidase family protein [Kordia antarctica]QHI35011.1 Gamma-D-glutamyl-L-diamino acid endopeptidase 1 [Kordia antarctica]
MQTHKLANWYHEHFEATLQDRYITLEHIIQLLEKLPSTFNLKQLGVSVLDKPIHSLTIGNGSKKILMWSQMHGNESTTTKAIFDLLNFLSESSEISKMILNNCTLCIIPMLNPDGSAAYTRENANEIDLNRDAQTRSQPESVILRSIYDEFQPDYCFNLHGQRTIFSAGNHYKSAIVSFLTPSEDEKRSITPNREKSMEIIVKMNEMLQKLIPNHVARYDDGFNLNCVGDTFQSLGTPTVLFEAGHFPNDYARERTRELIFYAIMEAIQYIASNEIKGTFTAAYFEIPENEKLHYDILLKNLQTDRKETFDVGVMYKEILKNGKIHFEPYIEDKKMLKKSFAHKIIDFQEAIAQTYIFQSFSLEIEVSEYLRKFNKNGI